MKNALILHGTDFRSKGNQRLNNWFPWLKTELEIKGYEVWVPELPRANEPNLARYWSFLKDYNFNKETVLVGHSSGGATVFGILNNLPPALKIRLAVSVAGFYKDEGWNCEGLFPGPFDWPKIKAQAEKIEIIYSDDDPYVKPYHAEYFEKRLGVPARLMKGKKHFNLEAGDEFRRFPELLEIVGHAA